MPNDLQVNDKKCNSTHICSNNSDDLENFETTDNDNDSNFNTEKFSEHSSTSDSASVNSENISDNEKEIIKNSSFKETDNDLTSITIKVSIEYSPNFFRTIQFLLKVLRTI